MFCTKPFLLPRAATPSHMLTVYVSAKHEYVETSLYVRFYVVTTLCLFSATVRCKNHLEWGTHTHPTQMYRHRNGQKMPNRFIKNTCFSTANSPDISSKIFSSVSRNTAGKCHNTSLKMYCSQLQIFPDILWKISTFLPQTLWKQCPVSSKIQSFHRKITRRSFQKYLFLSPQLVKLVIQSNPYSRCPIKTPSWKMSQCDVKNIQ